MNRFKRHKVKREKQEPSASYSREAEEHDLAYYIHDRVELMHQVFSVLKHKELRAMAPECVRHISIDDLQELCTEELLGISSKRLCAILDGAEPPSETESSSQSEPEQLETISLDSISSDEEILSQTSSKKKKHKHRRRDSKSKTKKKGTKSKELEDTEDAEKSKASRAGLTVLELLELQARARAIRAQLQQEQAKKQTTEPTPAVDNESGASENEVEIKEEPPEVVEISSDEEKPKIEELQTELPKSNDDANKNGVEVDATNKNSEKIQVASKSKEKKSKKDKSKKDKKKEKQNKKKNSEKDKKDSAKDSETDENDLRKIIEKAKNKSPEVSKEVENTQKVTKKINDLIITVPQQHSRKIRLNRNKVTVCVTNNEGVAIVENSNRSVSVVSPEKNTNETTKSAETSVKSTVQVVNKPKEKVKDKSKKKHKRKERKKSSDKDASDHDEITLQLSDSEKMDLLEDFDRGNLDNVTSSSEDSESSSDSDSDSSPDSSKDNTIETFQTMPVENIEDKSTNNNENKQDLDINGENKELQLVDDNIITKDIEEQTSKEVSKHIEDSNTCANEDEKHKNEETVGEQNEIQVNNGNDSKASNSHNTTTTDTTDKSNNVQSFISSNDTENNLVVNDISDIPIREDILETQNNETDNKNTKVIDEISETAEKPTEIIDTEKETAVECSQKSAEINTENINLESTEHSGEIDNDTKSNDTTQNSNKSLSEGEVSSNESSEVEACELKPEVVCISDEETDSNKAPKKKQSKKKEKKSKKEKKVKKSKSDFRESADQNFYRDVEIHVIDKEEDAKVTSHSKDCVSLVDDDDVYEILELSDDSSCYEVEGTVLSKEPTAEEIEALSAKIDEIEREEVVTEEQIREHERGLMEKLNTNENNTENGDNVEDNLENISWKDRYLGSKKVKTVLTTSNILNALRKKNKELKKKLEESKKKEVQIEEETEIPVENKELEEGSIEHYNTLQGSTKYVNPVPDAVVTENKEIDESTLTPDNIVDKNNIEIQVTGEMKKDAKQLLKMYKKLLKYNDMTKPKDPNKKKKKKQKKKEKDSNIVASSDVVTQ